ncbi:MAG: FAD binding domain-containing protein [Candidatus Marinimicrobia bacterium]|nr:FAD binding domain-containing protein [Candidatus Neomarinimicrobiota bacterium]
MWASIERVEFPESLEAAYRSAQSDTNAIFAGGTYLIAEKKPLITTLVDINKLLLKTVETKRGLIRIGAGATLQQLVEYFPVADQSKLGVCARWCCSSKNIRNARTIGGEISRGRPDSEVLVMLKSLEADLEVIADRTAVVSLRDWDGNGIIKTVLIDKSRIKSTALQRFALLPSARAFVITTAMQHGDTVSLGIGGDTDRISCRTISIAEFTPERIDQFSSYVSEHFRDNHLGSRQYKQSVVRTGLKRVREEL